MRITPGVAGVKWVWGTRRTPIPYGRGFDRSRARQRLPDRT
jgi:hypothetical protein